MVEDNVLRHIREDYGIEFKNQINNSTCVHACLAMVTRKSVEKVVEEAGGYENGLTLHEEKIYLAKNGYSVIYSPVDALYQFSTFGVHLVSLPSKNVLGRMHRVVVVASEKLDDIIVIDPQMGREGVKTFGYTDIMTGKAGYCEITYVQKI